MKKATIFSVIFFPLTAMGAGDNSEALCDNPGSGVTCKCSEPFTYNEGTHIDESWNPVGTTPSDVECNNGENVVNYVSRMNVRSVRADSLTQQGEPLTVGGSGYVLQIGTEGHVKIDDVGPSFTNGTYCTRRYIRWDPAFSCNGASSCNFKGPRYESTGGPGNHLGFEIWGPSGDGVTWNHSPGAYNGATIKKCVGKSPDNGCNGVGKMTYRSPSGQDLLTWEKMQTGWTRWEICVDHNLSASQIAAANAKYGSALVYPGENFMFFRARLVQVTGPYAGDMIMHGPTYTEVPVSTANVGDRARHFSTTVGSRETEVDGTAWVAYFMATVKQSADPLYWVGPAIEVDVDRPSDGSDDFGGAPTPTPITTPPPNSTPIPTPTPQAIPTPTLSAVATPSPTPGASPNETVTLVDDLGCPGSTNPNPAILFCDDFDDGVPITDKWSTYYSGTDSYVPIPGIGIGGSTAMRASWTQGQVRAGSFSIGLGGLPAFYLPGGGGENWQHVISPDSDFREIYWRQYLKLGAGWSGVPRKFSRVRVLSDPQPGDGAHPTAFQGHLWQQINTNQGGTIGALMFDNSRGVNEDGEVIDTGNNSGTPIWLPKSRGSTVIFQDYPQDSEWICIEAHVKLNDPGLSNGIEEFWINGQLDARRTDQNHVGIYTDYGLNQVVFDNYWNDGSPQYNELYRDNIVISTERIGCLPDSELGQGDDVNSIGKPGTPYVVDP